MKNSLFYFGSSLFQLTAGYIVLPLLITNAGLYQYSMFFITVGTSMFVSGILSFGIVSIINAYYNYWRITNTLHSMKTLLIVIFLVKSILAICTLLLIELYVKLEYAFPVVILALLLDAKLLYETFARYEKKYTSFALLACVSTSLDLTLKLFYLQNFEYELKIYLYTSIVSLMPYMLILSIEAIPKISACSYNRKKLFIFLKYGFNNWRADLLGVTVAFVDKPLLAQMSDANFMAYYAIAQRFNGTIGTLRNLIKNYWLPLVVGSSNNEEFKRYNTVFTTALSVLIAVVILVAPFYLTATTQIGWKKENLTIVYAILSSNILWISYYLHTAALIKRKCNDKLFRIQFLSSFSYLVILLLSFYIDKYFLVISFHIKLIVLVLATRVAYTDVFNNDLILFKQTMCLALTFFALSLIVPAVVM